METLESEIWRKRFETDGNCFFVTRVRSQPGWGAVNEMPCDGDGFFAAVVGGSCHGIEQLPWG